MDTILITLIVVLLALNVAVIFFLLRNKQQKTEDPTQTFKNEFNSFKDSFSQSFGHMSKDIAKDMTGALSRVDEKVGVFNRQVEELNKSQENFSRILAGVKQYGVLAEFVQKKQSQPKCISGRLNLITSMAEVIATPEYDGLIFPCVNTANNAVQNVVSVDIRFRRTAFQRIIMLNR